MISFDALQNFFPERLRNNAVHAKHILKEYVQLMVLDYLSASPHARSLIFIGGTNLRMIKGIDRFSEDLDFDCRDMPREAFMSMTGDIIAFLCRNGLNTEARDIENSRLKAFRRNLLFPGLLQELGLSGHRDERFLLKIECQDQHYVYTPATAFVKGCGYAFPFPVPPDPVLCSMKLSAMLSRSKGRDFYDAIFLLQQTKPDYDFLAAKCDIHDLSDLKKASERLLGHVDLTVKRRDFEHLLFSRENSNRILNFAGFMKSL
jgi:hypothetical protein